MPTNRDPRATLEFDRILETIAGEALSDPGRRLVLGFSPFPNPEALAAELSKASEMADLVGSGEPFPLEFFSDLNPHLERAAVIGAFLEPVAFLEIARFCAMIRRLLAFSSRDERHPLIRGIINRMTALPDLEKAVNAAVDPHGLIRDGASLELRRIRHRCEGLVSAIRRKLDSVMRGAQSKGWAQEDALVIRDGRLVIPVKENHRGQIPGVVVDQSASGGTVFMEPYEVLELQSELARARIEETREIERILRELTDLLRPESETLESNLDISARLDSLRARAVFGNRVKSVRGEIGSVLDLRNGRHPLLILKGRNVVPLDLVLGGDVKALVLSGPNAGGKTVALKTVGLLSLMHHHGLLVPADEGTAFPWFSGIHADIGDLQSIERDLSTFSSHVENIRSILESASASTLVLLDELGSSTDPDEGGPLAAAILRFLIRKGCMVVATTHIGMLKAFAHHEPGMRNASMLFDPETLSPSYRFQTGVPGSSYAFEIAARLGIPQGVLDDARTLAGETRGRLDALIAGLERELDSARRIRAEAEEAERQSVELVRLYQERLEALRSAGDETVNQIVHEAEDFLAEASAAAEKIVREIRESQASREAVQQSKAHIETLKKRRQTLAKPKSESHRPIKPGDRVKWRGHSGRGEVVTEPDREGRVLVTWNDVTLKILGTELTPVESNSTRTTGMASYESKAVSDEIDLRGMTVDEALVLVDQYLGEAVSAGLSQVRIIHGKGTGALRTAVGDMLDRHRRVKSRRFGQWNEGDVGVTIAEIA
jgi:DNA mismatch repair protein MutS2